MGKDAKTTTVTGTMRKIGIEGGIWAVISDQGESWELLGPPEDLKKNGLRVEVQVDSHQADVTIGMMGRSGHVKSFREL
jgi:hypothetical protein